MAETYDPAPVVGCYKSVAFDDDLIALSASDIRLNHEKIYSHYDYGISKEGQSPFIYAYPRGYLWTDGERLSFVITDPEGGATLIPQNAGGKKAFRLPVFPSDDVTDFGANIQLVTFVKTPCAKGILEHPQSGR